MIVIVKKLYLINYMSLTFALENIPELRDKFNSVFKKPKLSVEKPLLVPSSSSDPTLIGTAFDYLLRFYLRGLMPFAKSYDWIATKAVAREQRMREPFEEVLVEAIKHYNKFIKDEILTDALLASILKLSKLDIKYRSGYYGGDLDDISKDSIQELRKLISFVEVDKFMAKSVCLLNPEFKEGSKKLRGTDADILIDDVLIDIKTLAKLHLRIDSFRQLVGYYTLHRIFGIGDLSPEYSISKLGIYFSRFGYLYTFNVAEVVDEAKFQEFKSWFIEFLETASDKISEARRAKFFKKSAKKQC